MDGWVYNLAWKERDIFMTQKMYPIYSQLFALKPFRFPGEQKYQNTFCFLSWWTCKNNKNVNHFIFLRNTLHGKVEAFERIA